MPCVLQVETTQAPLEPFTLVNKQPWAHKVVEVGTGACEHLRVMGDVGCGRRGQRGVLDIVRVMHMQGLGGHGREAAGKMAGYRLQTGIAVCVRGCIKPQVPAALYQQLMGALHHLVPSRNTLPVITCHPSFLPPCFLHLLLTTSCLSPSISTVLNPQTLNTKPQPSDPPCKQKAELTDEQRAFIEQQQAAKEAAAAESVEKQGPTSFFHGKEDKDYQGGSRGKTDQGRGAEIVGAGEC